MMNNQQLGAHELMEAHEVLTATINGINLFKLYQPHCQDPELQNILQNQLNFMYNEYNNIVSTIGNQPSTTGQLSAGSSQQQHASPQYGLRNPSPQQPNTSINEIDDHDISSAMLECSKNSATLRMHAALECADPHLRNLMIQGAKNCADQAYETWNFMNQRGYYQVPTLMDKTTQTFTGIYQPANNMNLGGQMGTNPNRFAGQQGSNMNGMS